MVNGRRRTASGGASPRSSTTRPNCRPAARSAERLHRLLHGPLIQVAAQPGIGDNMAADPQQTREIDAGRRGRRGIELIERIDERHQFPARGGGRHRLQQQAGAPRRAGADQFREMPARQAAAKTAVERGKAGGPTACSSPRIERGQCGGERPIETPFPEGGHECACGRHGAASMFSPFVRLARRTIAQAFRGDQARDGVG